MQREKQAVCIYKKADEKDVHSYEKITQKQKNILLMIAVKATIKGINFCTLQDKNTKNLELPRLKIELPFKYHET